MDSHQILVIFFILLYSGFLVTAILEIMNLNSSLKSRNAIPSFLSSHVSPKQFDRILLYTEKRGKFALVSAAINTAITAALILSGIPAQLLNWIQSLGIPSYPAGAAYILVFSFLLFTLALPLTLYSRFVLEEEFDFNKMTFRLFFIDTLKEGLVSIVLFVPLLIGLFFFIDHAGSFWWIYAFLFFTAFQLIITLIYPLVIAPLFNRFSELDDGPLKERLLSLAGKTSFKAKGIYKMDGSKRSAHSNAYFTGFGKARRIVLYDTLIEKLDEEEIEAVLAHEIGHFRKKHILKNLVLSLFTVLLFFFILSLLINCQPLYSAFGFDSPSVPALLIILSFLSEPLLFFFKPLFSALSRKNEYEADRFAVETTGNSETLSRALIDLGKDNLSNPTPHKLYSAFHYSHPALSERLTALEKKAEAR